MLVSLSAQARQDTAGTVELLENLNIISAKDTAAEGITTRAEFVKFAVKITGNSASYTYDKPIFTDVAKTYWAYDEICSAYSMGLIKPDKNGRFNPDSPIKAAAAARILLNVVGYGDYVKNRNDVEVISIAANKEILDNVSIDGDTPLSKEDVFRMLYNTLHVDLAYISGLSGNNPTYSVIEGKTLLTERFDVEYVEGVVTANERYAISGKKANKKSIIINNENYDITDIDGANAFLGLNVRCYWRETTSSQEVLCIYEKKCSYVSFGFEDAVYSKGSFGTYIDSKLHTYDINTKTTILINGSPVKDTTLIKTSLEQFDGSIRMIDNNNDDVYDIVIIERYKNIIVEKYDPVNEILKAKDGEVYTFNSYSDVFFEDVYREEISEIEFKVDNVISVFAPISGNETIVFVESKTFEAVVTGYSTSNRTSVFLEDGSEYKTSNSYLGKLLEISTGETYDFYLDFNGYLVYAERKVNKALLGYMVSAWISDDESDMMLRIYTSMGKMETLKASRSFTIRATDGTAKTYRSPGEIYDKLDAENSLKGVPVMYRKNSKEEVTKLYLASSNQAVEFHTLDDDGTTITNNRYIYRNYSFSGKYMCTPDTVFMTVPMFSGDINEYKITSAAVFKAGGAYRFGTKLYKRNSAINIAIEPDGFLTDFFVFKVDKTEPFNATGTTATPMLVKSIIDAVNADNEAVKKMTVLSYNGTEKSYELAECEAGIVDMDGNAVHCGDIIRIYDDEYGNVTKKSIQVLYDSENEEHLKYSDSTTIITIMRVIPVKVVARDDKYIKHDTFTGTSPEEEKASREITNIGSAKVFVYNKTKNIVEESDITRITKDDKFVMYTYYESARMIVYYED